MGRVGLSTLGRVDVAVIGAGLAGGLLALALAEQQLSVVLIGPAPLAGWLSGQGAGPIAPATAWSYAGVGGAALGPWKALEQRHGDLGLVPRRLHVHGSPLAPVAWLWRREPFAQLDLARFAPALSARLEHLGVRQIAAAVLGPPSPMQGEGAGGWQLALQSADGRAGELVARQVVLAAGAGCRALWPPLPERLRTSWAGLLQLECWPDPAPRPSRWLRRVRAGGMVLPSRFERLDLERRSATLEQPAWVVDAGLVPWGEGALLGQISLVRPGVELGEPPDAAWMEAQLRRGLAQLDPTLAALPGRYCQVPVSFCTDGRPLVGPIDEAPGLWVFAGFSGAFFQVPAAATEQAAAMATASAAARAS